LFAPQISQLEILDRNGHSLRAARPDAGPFHQRVSYSEIPQPLVQATLAAEDRRFRTHHGVDWRATFRAACQFVVHRRVISGGSTITQQLIKLAEPRPRTFRTKIIECLQALRLEQVWGKQRILGEYLNRLEYGNFNTGCSAAAQFYFAKPLRDLSAAECALLAGLPQAPSRLNPVTHFDRAHKRQQWILSQMRQADSVTAGEFERAKEEPMRFAPPRHAFEAPHFVDLLLQQLAADDRGEKERSTPDRASEEEHARSKVGRSNIIPWQSPISFRTPHSVVRAKQSVLPSTVTTTLDLNLNHFAEKVIRERLPLLRVHQAHNAAVVVIENRTGDVLALIGSENYFAPGSGQVNGAWAPRSAGSTFKPFTYLLAFEHGATTATIVADVPTDFATATGLFSPVNYNRHCYGPMRYRLALANSLNISAVKVLASIGGPEPLWQRLQACGLTTLTRSAEDYGLGLTIGNAEARLLELANAYACLARLGEYRPYRLRRGGDGSSPANVSNPRASGDEPSPPHNFQAAASRQVADPAAAYLIADILSDNAARTLAFGAETPLRFDFPVACKTGTSSDFRDNWAFGYTPEFTVGVWVGNFDGTPMQQVSGVTGAGPILHDLFEHLHSQFGTTWYPAPRDIVEYSIHPLTGHRLVPSIGTPSPVRLGPSPAAITEKFLTSNLPPIEIPADYQQEFSSRITHHGSPPILLSPEYRDWFASADNWLAKQAVVADSKSTLRITFPLPGTTFYLDPDLPHQGRRVHLQAQGPEDLLWQSDSLKFEKQDHRQIALLSEGRHEIVVSDPRNGAQAETWIQVLSR
jgi:penicillin-binding protein 1C